MAREIQKRDIFPILSAASEWRKFCLIDDNAMFCDDDLWTLDNCLALYAAFVEKPDESDRDFLTKLKDQLRDTTPSVIKLAAEMLWVLFLFPSNIKPDTKIRQFREVWSLSGAKIPNDFPTLEDKCLVGIGSGGPGFNTYRPNELAYLIKTVLDLKGIPKAKRIEVLNSYQECSAWIGKTVQFGRRQFRHMLRYFLFPDRVERISSDSDRRLILRGFHVASAREMQSWSDVDTDEALFKLRGQLQTDYPGQVLDFYEPPLRGIWSREKKIKTPSGEITVTVPDDAEDTEAEKASSDISATAEPRQSFQMQAKLAEIGAAMRFKVWIPPSDRGRVTELMADAARGSVLDVLPLNYDDTTLDTIKQIDVIWLKGRSIVRAFEVEHTTAVYSGLLRMADLLALQPNMDIRLHIVAADARRDKVFAEMRRPVFSLLERGPMSQSCSFLSYENVDALRALEHLAHMSDGVIAEFEERAEPE